MPPLIQLGPVVLHSGATSDFKLVADEFIRDNLPGLVHLVRRMVGPFSAVEGVPRGGLALAAALEPFAEPGWSLLLVDDVFTTGGSMRQHRGDRHAIGAVVFARGPVEPWIRAVFVVNPALWLPAAGG